MLMEQVISRVFSIFWKDVVKMVLSILCMLHPVQFMVPIPQNLSKYRTMWIIQSACTLPPKKLMNSWPIPTVTFTDFHVPGSGFSQFTVPGADLIWHISFSQKPSLKVFP